MKFNLKGKSEIFTWYEEFCPLKRWHDDETFMRHWDEWYSALVDTVSSHSYQNNIYVDFFQSDEKLYIKPEWII